MNLVEHSLWWTTIFPLLRTCHFETSVAKPNRSSLNKVSQIWRRRVPSKLPSAPTPPSLHVCGKQAWSSSCPSCHQGLTCSGAIFGLEEVIPDRLALIGRAWKTFRPGPGSGTALIVWMAGICFGQLKLFESILAWMRWKEHWKENCHHLP